MVTEKTAVVRLGDANYWSIRKAVLGDMHDIFVDGVVCRAKRRWT